MSERNHWTRGQCLSPGSSTLWCPHPNCRRANLAKTSSFKQRALCVCLTLITQDMNIAAAQTTPSTSPPIARARCAAVQAFSPTNARPVDSANLNPNLIDLETSREPLQVGRTVQSLAAACTHQQVGFPVKNKRHLFQQQLPRCSPTTSVSAPSTRRRQAVSAVVGVITIYAL